MNVILVSTVVSTYLLNVKGNGFAILVFVLLSFSVDEITGHFHPK